MITIWEGEKPIIEELATEEDVLSMLEFLAKNAETKEERDMWEEIARLQREDMRKNVV